MNSIYSLGSISPSSLLAFCHFVRNWKSGTLAVVLLRKSYAVYRGSIQSSMAKIRDVTFALGLISVLSLFSSANSSSTDEAFIKNTVSSHNIVIFSKSYCPYCRRAKEVFKSLNKAPYVVELDGRDDGADIQDALSVIVGRRTVPQVFINGKHLGGSDDTMEAYVNGELHKLLGIPREEEDL